MVVQIRSLKPGTRFRLAQTPDLICGELVRVSFSRAVVKLDRPPKVVDFETLEGWKRINVKAGRLQSWTPFAPVIPLESVPLESDPPCPPFLRGGDHGGENTRQPVDAGLREAFSSANGKPSANADHSDATVGHGAVGCLF